MKVNRWNFEKHKYDVVVIPDHWFVVTTAPLGIHINCISCGKDLLVDDSYTSYRYQDSIGFGYLICEECMKNEFKVRERHQDEQEL